MTAFACVLCPLLFSSTRVALCVGLDWSVRRISYSMPGAWPRQMSLWGRKLKEAKMIQAILQVIVMLLRAALAAVLVAAGAAKLADTRSFARTLIGLGVPARWRLLLRALTL